MAATRERAGSLHRPPSGIRLPLRPSLLHSEAEEQEVTVLESEAVSEEEVKVDNRQIFFRPCRWINFPFARLMVLAEGEVAVATAASEVEEGCVPRGVVVGIEVVNGRVRCHCRISLVWRSRGDAVICFRMPDRTEGKHILPLVGA